MQEESIIAFNQRNVYIGKSKKGYGFTYFTKRNFKRGKLVMHGFGKLIDHQTPHFSIQIDFKKHLLPMRWTGKYLNHSCNPNMYIRTRDDDLPDFIALRDIKKNQEITFAYYMSEYEWTKGAAEGLIRCRCGSKRCRGKIFPFSQLFKKEQLRLIKNKLCSGYLRRLDIS